MDIAWWFLLGAVTWAISVGVKIAVSGAFDVSFRDRISDTQYTAFQGLLSAVTELGAAAIVFAYMLSEGTLIHAVAFGAGAGILEAVILLVMALLSKEKEERVLPWYQEWTFVIERFGALLGHIGSRGLVWLSIHGPAYPFIIAILGFATVDGVATYGVLKKWDWLQPKIWKQFYSFVTLAGVAEITLFLGLYYIIG